MEKASYPNRPILEYLKRIGKNQNQSGCFLFTGPVETGKREAVWKFIKTVNPNLREEMELSQASQSVFWIKPEIEKTKDKIREKDIALERVKEGIRRISFQPVENQTGFLIIEKAEKMTVEASNSLLKVMEELPARAIIILLSHREEILLDTIKSRCQKIIFSLQSEDKIRSYLFEKFPQEPKELIERAAKFAKGKFILAQRLVDEKKLLQEKEKTLEEFRQVLKKGLPAAMQFVKQKSVDRKALVEEMELWIIYLSDFLKTSISQSQDRRIQRKVFLMVEDLWEIKNKIEKSNVNARLMLENFFVQNL